MKIGIGIDTGGTYTDTVMYDFSSGQIIGSSKSLTTREDLSIGILAALDQLPSEFLQKAKVVSLSTTLATNACVEDTGGKAKLIFFGGNAEVLKSAGSKYGLPPVEKIYLQEAFTSFSGESSGEVDWESFEHAISDGFQDYDAVGIVEMYAIKNGAFIEKKAKEIFSQKHDIPVVCGHELFSELNSLQRASSTLLNARLLPVIDEFLTAIDQAMRERKISAEIVIVRSDGSMMSREFAKTRPVETLLCGPAASVIGGQRISGAANSVIIDMGGTTTDIALVKENVPLAMTNGISIGKWRTFVSGLYVKTFGLGGDSAIHFTGKYLQLEDYRVYPLCMAAAKHPVILDNLRKLTNNLHKHTMPLHEHYMLIKDISHSSRHTDFEKNFCQILAEGPLSIEEAPLRMGKDIYNFNINRLLQEEVVKKCGLTPTDIMHLKGDFNGYEAEASALAATFVAYNLEISVDELCEQVYDNVKKKIYINVVKALLENKYPRYLKETFSNDLTDLLEDTYEASSKNRKDQMLHFSLASNYTLVGIGAPIKIFLKDIAALLGTKAIVAEHFEVANALGAIAGNVYATQSIEVRPITGSLAILGYTVFGIDENKDFETLEDAEKFALQEAERGASAKARERGAKGNITLSTELQEEKAAARDCLVYLGSTARARAIGTIGF